MFEDMISVSVGRWGIMKCVIFFPDTPFSKPHPHAINEHSFKNFLGLHSLQTWDDYYQHISEEWGAVA